jgi:Asp-tRNA(Asn)/Glu-tRNA(Gln) amidotransferase A subunit family amidase
MSARVGKEIELLHDDGVDLASALEAFTALQGAQVWNNFGDWVDSVSPELGPDIAARMTRAACIGQSDIDQAETTAAAVVSAMRRLEPGEVLVLPSAGTVAPARDATSCEREEARRVAGQLTCLASLADLPAVSLPWGHEDSLPVGIGLVGARRADRLPLALAAGQVSSR